MKTFARTINRLKDVENLIADRIHTADEVMQELHRVAHRQFPWQSSKPSASHIIRYFLLYKHPPLESIIRTVIGLTVDELLLVGMALLGVFLTNIAQLYPPTIEIPTLTMKSIDRFLLHFSLDLPALKRKLHDEVQMNDRLAYAYNSLRAYPLIRMRYQGKDSLVCPLPTILYWRFTSGVYYEICDQGGFASAFGDAFQGEVLNLLEK